MRNFNFPRQASLGVAGWEPSLIPPTLYGFHPMGPPRVLQQLRTFWVVGPSHDKAEVGPTHDRQKTARLSLSTTQIQERASIPQLQTGASACTKNQAPKESQGTTVCTRCLGGLHAADLAMKKQRTLGVQSLPRHMYHGKGNKYDTTSFLTTRLLLGCARTFRR